MPVGILSLLDGVKLNGQTAACPFKEGQKNENCVPSTVEKFDVRETMVKDKQSHDTLVNLEGKGEMKLGAALPFSMSGNFKLKDKTRKFSENTMTYHKFLSKKFSTLVQEKH